MNHVLKTILCAALACALALCPAACAEQAAEESLPLMGAFAAEDIYGTALDQDMLADYELNMINVWGTFCGPCISEMPDLARLAEDYAGQGVQLIGIVGDVTDAQGVVDADTLALAQEIAEEAGAAYPHLVPSEDLIQSVMWQITAYPTTFFVDAEGRLTGQAYLGSRSYEEWAEILDETIDGLKTAEE